MNRQHFLRGLVGSLLFFANGFGKTAFASCCPAGTGSNACYMGGPLIQHPHIYISRWNYNGDTVGYFSHVESFLGGVNGTISGLGGSKYLNTLTQYSAGSYTVFNDVGIVKGDTYQDSTPYVNNPPPRAEVAAAAARAASAYGVGSDPDAVILVMTGASRSRSGCGPEYHDYTSKYSVSPSVPFIDLWYLGDKVGGSACPGPYAGIDYVGPVLQHELAETITDPRVPNACTTGTTGWVDNNDKEIVDNCDPFVKVRLDWAGTTYYVTDMWSNEANNNLGQCVYSHSTRQDFFYIDTGGVLQHNYYDTGGGGADSWGSPVGATLHTGLRPGAVAWFYNAIDVFAPDTQSPPQLQHVHGSFPAVPAWDSWGSLPSGYNIVGGSSAASWKPGRVDAFVLGQSGAAVHVFHKYFDAVGYSAWQDWGTPAGVTLSTTGVGAAAWAAGEKQIDLYVSNGTDIWHGWSTSGDTLAGWNNWGHLGTTTILGTPEASSWGDQRQDAFYVTSTGLLAHKSYEHGTLSGWDTNFGSPVTNPTSPSAIGMSDGSGAGATTGELIVGLRIASGGLGTYQKDYGYGTMSAWGILFASAGSPVDYSTW